MEHAIVVSPHLDDAALSCGGGIARLVHAGTQVTVVTVFTADQPLGEPLSTLARRAHASWGIGDQPFAVRREEDRAGLSLLGAQLEHLGLLDVIYRRAASGKALYADPLSTPAPEDIEHFLPRVVAALEDSAAAHPQARVFCPAGVGGHVDHELTRRAVERVVESEAIVYYDEYPYSARPAASKVTSGAPSGWHDYILPLSAEELELRIAAIRLYVSQLRGLFPSEDERLHEIASAHIPVVGKWLVGSPDVKASGERMAAHVRRDMASLGGERYRWPSGCESPFPEAHEPATASGGC
jgi:LmbE family N-acetylglucosaminyl deacetylase